MGPMRNLIKAFTSLAIPLKNSMTRIRRSLWAALVVVAFAVSPVLGKDLNVLVRVLYSAFVAEQGSSMCMVPSVTLLQTERSVFIGAHNYAQLVKQKVTAGLSDYDGQFVLRSAADQAKEDVLVVVKRLKSSPPEQEYAELLRWCRNNMKPAAEKLVRAYIESPGSLDKLIEDAKHD
jgi:hypothetical protein